jgi:DNA-binding MarR family transcriptional regulator
MARARPVSRQHIQTLVDQLAGEGHVELTENPAHKRSHLVRLTRKGSDLIDGMNRREAKIFAGLKIGIAEKDLRLASAVLRAVRQLLESDQWKRLVRGVR